MDPLIRLPPPPPEVPRIATLDNCAPLFVRAVTMVCTDMRDLGFKVKVYETLRTVERQNYLFGFGRQYDDGRGEVTKASGLSGWHPFGVAADIVEDDATPWQATNKFWTALGEAAGRHGLTWGGRWPAVDLPHVQWGRCRRSPTQAAQRLLANGGLQAVWNAVGAL